LVPSDNIVPTGEEVFNALKYLGDYLLGNNGIEKSVLQESPGQWKDLKRRRR
jgi:extracellular matrix protein 14